jgi:glycosyltransferase involved in cell wall biosynthesis
MKIAFAHDYLTQRGGAERFALAMMKLYPDAPLYTSVYRPRDTFEEFFGRDIRTSFIQRLPIGGGMGKVAPLLPAAWNGLQTNADVVVASSSGWAHSIEVQPGAKKIVYCHNPARWLYQADEYFENSMHRTATAPLRMALVCWDRRHAKSADLYLANSSVVAGRITRVYGIPSIVVHPPVMLDVDAEQDPDLTIQEGYWLTVARARGYKNTSILVDSMSYRRNEQLVVVGSPPDEEPTPRNVIWTGNVGDARLRWLYANARALVSVSSEDFGLTPLEANAFGTPSLLLRAGGFLDTLDEGVSGIGIDAPTVDAVVAAMKAFPDFDSAPVVAHAAKFSMASFKENMDSLVASVWEGRQVV